MNTPASVAVDTLKLYDRDNKLVGTVEMPKRKEGQPPRRIVWGGRKFKEGDATPDTFYGPGEMGEID